MQIRSVFGAEIADHLAKMIDREMHELFLILVHSGCDLSCDFRHQVKLAQRRFQIAKGLCLTQISLLLALYRFRPFLALDFGRSSSWRKSLFTAWDSNSASRRRDD
jgi:hypothetical protein